MPKRKVRHALIQYKVDGRNELGFRGQTVDLSTDEAKRLDDLGATVAAGDELERPGTLSALRESPTDEELVAWVIAATPTEVETAVRNRPELLPRIEGAQERVKTLTDYQDERLEQAARTASRSGAKAPDHGPSTMTSGDDDPEKLPGGRQAGGEGDNEDDENGASGGDGGQGGNTPPPPATPGSGDENTPSVSDPTEGTPNTTVEAEAAAQAAGTGTDPDEAARAAAEDDVLSAEEVEARADEVVAGSVDDVSDFLADNPDWAQDILDAEARLAEAEDREVRKGVRKSAEVAAGHTS